jgi:hypothetical protein
MAVLPREILVHEQGPHSESFLRYDKLSPKLNRASRRTRPLPLCREPALMHHAARPGKQLGDP